MADADAPGIRTAPQDGQGTPRLFGTLAGATRVVIDILDEHGQPYCLRLPLYDVLLGDAEAIWALVIGYLRLLGAAYGDVVSLSPMGPSGYGSVWSVRAH